MRPPARLRRVVAVTMVVVAWLAFLVGGAGVWANRSLLSTDTWVERAGTLAEDPEVQSALSRWLTAEVMVLIDPDDLFAEALPERGQVLAIPLSVAVEGFVGDRVERFVASDTFSELWVTLNEQVHRSAVRALRGGASLVEAGEESVTLNLIPVINEVLARITAESPEVLGRTVTLPDVRIDERPAAAITRINERLGTDLSPDFGQITVYDDGALREVRAAVALFDAVVWASLVLLVASTLAALALSVDRRRTVVLLSVAGVLVLVLVRRAAAIAQGQLLGLVRVDANVAAVTSVSDALLAGLFDATRALLGVLGAIIVVAWLSGRSTRAVAVRRRSAAVAGALAGSARARSTDPATRAWVADQADAVMVGGVVLAALALWAFELSWLGVLVVLALVAALLVLVARATDGTEDVTPGGGAPAVAGTRGGAGPTHLEPPERST